MFLTGPKVVKSVMFMDISAEDLGGASIHSKKSGVAHFRCEGENECYEKVRKLLDYIPHYYGDELVQAAKYHFDEKKKHRLPDFPGGPGVENPPANTGAAGSTPGPGRFHVLWLSAVEQLSPCATTTKTRVP